jgi:hypothetical protein
MSTAPDDGERIVTTFAGNEGDGTRHRRLSTLSRRQQTTTPKPVNTTTNEAYGG